MTRSHRISQLTWREVQAMPRDTPILLPVGTLEQNGPFCVMGTDTFIGGAFVDAVAEQTDGLVLENIPYSYSNAFKSFPGTVTLRAETLRALMKDVCGSLLNQGFANIIVVTHHAPNQAILEHVLREIRQEHGVLIPLIWTAGALSVLSKGEFSPETLGHGAEPHVSVLKGLDENYVRPEAATSDGLGEFRGFPVTNSSKSKFQGCDVGLFVDIDEVSSTGLSADGTRMDGEKGRKVFEKLVNWGVAFVREWTKTVKEDS